MIAYIIGTVVAIKENRVVIEHNQMGYNVFMPVSSIDGILRFGEEVKIHTYLHVKEDLLQLYGFTTVDDLEIFQLLLLVNGIGPKGALGILSGLSADELRFAILSDDVKTISKAPGIGKKTASKLILELKDKLNLEDAFEKKLSHVQNQVGEGMVKNLQQEAVQALVALGYSNAEALKAVHGVTEEVDSVEEILKLALKKMAFI